MKSANNLEKTIHSNAELAQMIVRVVQAAPADAIICATEIGAFAKQLVGLTSDGQGREVKLVLVAKLALAGL